MNQLEIILDMILSVCVIRNAIPKAQVEQQDHSRLCNQFEKSSIHLLCRWNKVGEHFNCCPSLVNRCKILDKENRARNALGSKSTSQPNEEILERRCLSVCNASFLKGKEIAYHRRVKTLATSSYRTSPLELVELKRQLEKLLGKQCVMVRVPLLLVEKKDESMKWCVDYHQLVFLYSSEPFIVYSDASKMSLSYVFMLKDLAFKHLKTCERELSYRGLELVVVVLYLNFENISG
ncbi:hypothetical protein CR513_24753, partial [Mucuna pruriens]